MANRLEWLFLHDNQQNSSENTVFCVFSEFFLKMLFQTIFGKVKSTLRNRSKTIFNVIPRLEMTFKHFSNHVFDESDIFRKWGKTRVGLLDESCKNHNSFSFEVHASVMVPLDSWELLLQL